MADIKEHIMRLIHLHDNTPVHLSGTASFFFSSNLAPTSEWDT